MGLRGLLCFAVWAVAFAGVSTLVAAPQAVQRSLLDFEQDYVATIGDDRSEIKVGATIDIVLLSGKRVNDVEIVEIQPGKEKHTFRSLSVKGPTAARKKFIGSVLLQLRAGDREFDVLLEPATKTYVLLDGAKRDEVAAARLDAQRCSLWTTPTDAQAQETIQEHKDLFAKISTTFATRSFTLHETAFFLFYTDIPAEQVGGYIANLDAMYQRLCQVFSTPLDKNIWLGKCAVVAFAEKASFQQFELQFMNNPDTEQTAGRHYGFSDGKVLISCCRGNDPLYFAALLVHETSHGFLHRYRSNVHIPSWLNEGIADWVAGVVVPASDRTRRRQATALAQLRSTGSMGGNFFGDQGKLESWQYGLASSLTHFLLAQDPGRYCALLTAIKEGYSWEEGLKLTFGATPLELVQEYGRSIAVPGLRP